MFLAMAPIISLFLLTTLFAYPFSLLAHKPYPSSRISVVGAVYCDTCSANSFSKQSYFLPGVEVHIDCTFKANSPKTAEQINFSVNRTTDRYGTYKLEIPEVDGVDCVDGSGIESLCKASLMKSSSTACDIPGLKTTTDQISVKSKQDNHCIYCLNALNYRPAKRNATLCGNHKQQDEELPSSFNSSKFFIPYFPPYGFFWPPHPPLPSIPFLPFPPFQYPQPPSLPFPFPPLPPFPPLFQPPPPPAFNIGDPRTWIPHIPSLSSPPPPPPPPPPPAFNLRDPKTWIPHLPPFPPNSPQNQNP